jgi:pyrroline-5-carboxylate reductase
MSEKIEQNITFLGAGNMAEALIKGLLAGGVVELDRISAADVNAERLKHVERTYKIKTWQDNQAAIRNADIIVICVKPQQVEELLSKSSASFTKTKIVMSIAAGITSDFIAGYLPADAAIVRIMPNTPCLVGAGAVAIALGKKAGEKEFALAKQLFSGSGIVVRVEEDKINSVTALSGSGPAYVFYLAEAMERAGLSMGLDKDISRQLAYETVFGAGKMLKELGEDAGVLRARVTSKGGTTEKAIESLEKSGFKDLFEKAIRLAEIRAKELSK